MATRRKGESLESYRARDAEAKRQRRLRKTLSTDPAAAVKTARIPEVLTTESAQLERLPDPDGVEPVKQLYAQIGLWVEEMRRGRAGEVTVKDPEKKLYTLCSSFHRLAVGLKTMQALATRDEVRQIVALVHPHLPEDVRGELHGMLDRIDARAGVTE